MCCPTSLGLTEEGLIAAYRGHTPEDIRDIEVARNVGGQWLQPRMPHADQWHFAGCPVNGPHLDTAGSRVALSWFSPSEDQPKVRLAFSKDGGLSFASALRVDEGSAIGRAQMVLLRDIRLWPSGLRVNRGRPGLSGDVSGMKRGWMQFLKLLSAQDSAYPHCPFRGYTWRSWMETRAKIERRRR